MLERKLWTTGPREWKGIKQPSRIGKEVCSKEALLTICGCYCVWSPFDGSPRGGCGGVQEEVGGCCQIGGFITQEDAEEHEQDTEVKVRLKGSGTYKPKAQHIKRSWNGGSKTEVAEES